MRVVVVSTISHIIANYWIKHCLNWIDRVDKVYVLCPNRNENIITLHHKIEIVTNTIAYPKNIGAFIKLNLADYYLVMHDDCFIHDPDFIDEGFEVAKDSVYAPVETNFGNISNTENALRGKYGNSKTFYPYLVFISWKTLEKTTYNFDFYESSSHSDLGTIEGGLTGDHGFALSLDLLSAGVNVVDIPRTDRWQHVRGISYNFMDSITFVPEVNSQNDLNKLAQKLAWLITFVDVPMEKVSEEYQKLRRPT